MFLGVVLSHAIQIGTAVGLQAQLCLLCGYSWRVIMAVHLNCFMKLIDS